MKPPGPGIRASMRLLRLGGGKPPNRTIELEDHDMVRHEEALERRGARAGRNRRSGPYDAWTVVELRKRAKELGLSGYSSLNKSDLVSELRNH